MNINLKLVTDNAATIAVANNNSQVTPKLILGVRNTVHARVTPSVDYSAITGWKLFLTQDYSSETQTLFRTFSGISVNNGEITADVIVDSEPLREELGSQKEKELILGIAGYNGVDSSPALLFQFSVILLNNADIDGVAEESLPELEYYNKLQVDARIMAAQLPDKWFLPITNVKYSDTLGAYAELLNKGDAVTGAYNAYGCKLAGLYVASANPEVEGNVTLKINGQNFTIKVTGETRLVELALNQPVSGIFKLELVSGLTDEGSTPVSIIITAITVSGACGVSDKAGLVRFVAAKPLFYSEELGYYHLLDDVHNIELCDHVRNLNAVILKLKSANSGKTGVAALKLTAGEAEKQATVKVEAEEEYAVIVLDAPASGIVKIERLTRDEADTLKDGASVVSAVVTDIQYNYIEG